MEFAPSYVDIRKLKRKMDVRNLTFQIAGETVYKEGRFYLLWKDGNFLVIQAEPWWRPDCGWDVLFPPQYYREEYKALWYLHEVVQTMLDSIVFGGEHIWAHLVRLPKDKAYRLVYTKKQLVHDCPIWTKVIELDDIEVTRFSSGLCWEGIYEEEDVDLLIGWRDIWGKYISFESHGQKLIESMGLRRYFFELKAHISRNGAIIGIMMEPLVGRCVTLADRSAVFEALVDIQRHGVTFNFQICDIYITEEGVRFASASSAEHHRDPDMLAKAAEFTWGLATDIFDHMDKQTLEGRLTGSRSRESSAFIVPRPLSPGRLMDLTRDEAIIRWIWSVRKSDEYYRLLDQAFAKLHRLYTSSEQSTTRRGKRIQGDNRALLPSDDSTDDYNASVARTGPMDKPLTVSGGLIARQHPYARPISRRLLLPPESA